MDADISLFKQQYRFKGRHAHRVYALTTNIESTKKTTIFPTNVSVFKNAPLIGYLYKRNAELDLTKDDETGKVYNQNIMDSQVIDAAKEMRFNFRLIMLLDKEYEPDEDKRIEKAFKKLGEDPKDIEHFEGYIRGGVDILYEHICNNAVLPDDYIDNIFEFVSDLNERYNEEINIENLIELTRK